MTATAATPTLRDRWDGLSRSARGALAVLGGSAAVFVAYRAPGLGPFLDDKAPFGIVVAGTIVGTVTALLAMGLILIYKTSRSSTSPTRRWGAWPGSPPSASTSRRACRSSPPCRSAWRSV